MRGKLALHCGQKQCRENVEIGQRYFKHVYCNINVAIYLYEGMPSSPQLIVARDLSERGMISLLFYGSRL